MRTFSLFMMILVASPAFAGTTSKEVVTETQTGKHGSKTVQTVEETTPDAKYALKHHLVAEGEVPEEDELYLEESGGTAAKPQPGFQRAVGTVGSPGDCMRLVNQQTTKGKMQVAIDAVAECRRIGIEQYRAETERLVAQNALQLQAPAVVASAENTLVVNSGYGYGGMGAMGAMFGAGRGPSMNNLLTNMQGLTPAGVISPPPVKVITHVPAAGASNPTNADEAERAALLEDVKH